MNQSVSNDEEEKKERERESVVRSFKKKRNFTKKKE
jgi:hypothetical protein